MQLTLVKTADEILKIRSELTGSVGVVPTMGNLHQGHISLVEESLKENDHTIVTIFVNPKQFSANEDFGTYPRTLDADCQLLLNQLDKSNSKKVLFVFAPKDQQEIYPADFQTTLKVSPLDTILCGKSRVGHFDGVATVVYRLFWITKPTVAYFGQKDFQQVAIIEKMARDLGLTLDIQSKPIVRDQRGLALSSRNQYLSAAEYEQALILPRTLIDLEQPLLNFGNANAIEAAKSIQKSDDHFEYLEIRDAKNLLDTGTFSSFPSGKAVVLGCYKIGKTRLIDNRVVKL